MKLAIKLIALLVIMGLSLANVAESRFLKATFGKSCFRPLSPNNRALSDSINVYLRDVGSNEIPVIVMQASGDTTHYYVTAFNATYMMNERPPSALVTVNNRETLLYEEKGSLAQSAPACWRYVLNKYSYLLRVDKLNRKEGRPPAYAYIGFNYDPIMGDVYITKENRIGTRHVGKIPFISND